MQAGVAGNGGTVVGVVGKLRRRTRTTRTLVAIIALRVRRPQPAKRQAIASGAGGPVTWTVGRRIQRQAVRVPVRPSKGSLERPIRTTDEPSKAIAATRRQLRRGHTGRLRLPRPREVRQALLCGPTRLDTRLVVLAIRVPARGLPGTNPARPSPVIPCGPRQLGTWMRRGRPISPQARRRLAPVPISRRGRANTAQVATEAATGLPTSGRRLEAPGPSPSIGLRQPIVVRLRTPAGRPTRRLGALLVAVHDGLVPRAAGRAAPCTQVVGASPVGPDAVLALTVSKLLVPVPRPIPRRT